MDRRALLFFGLLSGDPPLAFVRFRAATDFVALTAEDAEDTEWRDNKDHNYKDYSCFFLCVLCG